MFILVESIRAALNSINAHRFRAFLTSLGIIVGVASIIALVCVIQGLSGSKKKTQDEPVVLHKPTI